MIFARSWREFNKKQAIGLLSLYKKVYWFNPEFHFNINGEISEKWVDFVCNFIPRDHIHFYNDNFFDAYARESGVNECVIDKFSKWKWIYHILLYHYLYSKKDVDYLVTYDDDILFNEKNIDEAIGCIYEKIPFAIGETQSFSDKSMLGRLCSYFHGKYDININFWFCPNQELSCNSGFMGVDTSFFSRYNSLNDICSMFNYIKYEHREVTYSIEFEKFEEFFHGLLEEQSFLSINNKAFNPRTFTTLREEDGYNIRYEQIDEGYSDISKIEHYLGFKKYGDLYNNRITEEFNRLRILLLNNATISEFYNEDIKHPYEKD